MPTNTYWTDSMARLNDLNLRSTPDALDPEQEGTAEFLAQIEDLLATEDFDWASGTLEGIYNTVESRQVVTQGQRDAVEHITAARR